MPPLRSATGCRVCSDYTRALVNVDAGAPWKESLGIV